jgi:hypothetical protein
MDEDLDLRNIEKRAWRSAYMDGLWDIFFGMLFLGMAFSNLVRFEGLANEISNIIFIGIWNSAAVIFLFLGKKYITIPRIGFVKFGEKRKKTIKQLVIFLVINFLIAIIFAFFNISDIFIMLNLEGLLQPLIIGIFIITIPLTILAFSLDFRRLYSYAIFMGMVFVLTELLFPLVGEPYDALFSFGLIGFSIMAIGVFYLIQFLYKYRLKND